jgi:nitrate reductase NapD
MDSSRRRLLTGRLSSNDASIAPLSSLVSLVVRARPERMSSLKQAIEAIPAAEVHAITDDGRMVVTLEDCPAISTADALVRVQQLDHVICVTLAYEHCEPAQIQ